MTLFLGLVRHQCRCLATIGLCGFSLAVVIAVMAELSAGAEPAWLLRPDHLATVAAVLLPEVLQVTLPIALVHGIFCLADGGELLATRAAGVHPLRLATALLVPLLIPLVLLQFLVHDTRPAALARATTEFATPQQLLQRGAARHGVGIEPVGDGVHALFPVGDFAVAVRASVMTAMGHRVALADGEARVVLGPASTAASGGFDVRFERASLRVPPPTGGLRDRTERQLSTRFLATDSMRWRRARLDWQGRRSGELVRHEMRERELVVPATVGGLLVALLLLFWRRPLTLAWVHGVCTPLVVAVALFVPRIFA